MVRAPRAQLAFTVALGAIGWATLVAGLATRGLEVGATPGALGGFLAVVLAARALAFRVGATVLSLDSAFYVAAAVAIGPKSGGLLVAVALTLDAVVRRPRAEAGQGRWSRAAFALYFGGMSGGLLAALAAASATVTLAADRDVDAIAHVCALGAGFLVLHNGLQGLRHALGGRSIAWFVREQAGPGMIAEGSLLPLAAVVALLELAGQRAGLVLLCGTYLLVNLIFNRLARASRGWRQRIAELERLDHAARALGRSIELPAVVTTILTEVARAVPAAHGVALIHRGADRDPDRFVVDGLAVATARRSRAELPRSGGVVGRVVAELTPLALDDQAAAGLGVAPLTDGVGAWLGVPVFVDGTCEGVLAVHSEARGAFDRADLRLLASLALQAGAALAHAHLHAMAMVDGLTGLFVRRYFDARVDEEIARAERYGQSFAVVLIDLDDFKRLNDSRGHLVGDRALREVAAAIRAELRGVDTAARYGGEELALILPRTDLFDALALAERVRSEVAARAIAADDGTRLHLTASFGVAAFPDSGVADALDLIRAADRALYRAKRAGKNRCELAWPEPSAASYPAYTDGPPPAIH
ncbi:MAG: diguanylate cyclase [Kofleriaceae bacterium]|jgi:diguanylate cyclase (GGDEF)-like protein|nr:diguanylate cyclase [Kofleriaceae bacterium]MBP9169390.1 diguanylate cyclase [Kofleriaceae bacterium]MBP9862287.1 diguanylate cyclase [Kofleriaceae bacterium]